MNNKILKRHIALICTLIITTCIIYLPAGAEEISHVYENEKGLLRAVEILPETDLSAEKITRADFALYTTRLLGIKVFEKNNDRYFYDVPMNHYALNSINKLVELNIISLPNDREFRPDEIITFDEACKMLVSALGYDDIAVAEGGYPGGYLKMANRLKISGGISAGELLTENAVLMLYNALRANVEDVISISADGIYKKANGETALSVYHGIYFDEGTLTAINGQTMYNDLTAEQGQAYIDETRYSCSADLDDLFGSYIEYYYKKDSSNRRELIYAEELSDKTTVIDSDDFLRYDDGVVYYNKNNREASISTSDSRVIVYNGRPITTDIDNTFLNINYGTIIVKQSENKLNNLIIIHDYTDMYVSSISKITETVSDNKFTNSVINIKEWDNLIFKNTDGKQIEYTEIQSDVILSVKKSVDKKMLYGVVSPSIATGSIERIFNEGKTTKIIVDGTEYSLTRKCALSQKSKLKVGSPYKFYLNIDGDVACVNTDGVTNMIPGYLINAIKNDNSFDDNIKVRLLDQNGKRVVYETAGKVRIDGVDYTEADKMISAFPSDSGDKTKVEPQLILYRVSGEKIKEIDTYGGDASKEDKSSTLMRYLPAWNEVYYATGRFGWNIPVRDGGKVFTVPDDNNISSASDKKFKAETMNASVFGVMNRKTNNIFYKIGNESTFYDLAVIKGDAVVNMDAAYIAVVESIYEALDDEGNTIKAVSTFEAKSGGAASKTYKIDEDVNFDAVEEGDCIRYASDGDRITGCELLYDESSNALPNWKGINDTWNLYQEYPYYGDAFQLSFGYVSSKSDNVIRWAYKDQGAKDESWGAYISDNTGGSRMMIWDTEKKKAYIGDIGDVIDYDTYGRSSRVILQTCWSDFRAMLVYI